LPDGWRLIYSITTPNKIEILSVILEWFNQNQSAIRTILDVGPVQGTYFDLFNPVSDNKICWECVEIWEPYIYRFKLYRKYQCIFAVRYRNWWGSWDWL